MFWSYWHIDLTVKTFLSSNHNSKAINWKLWGTALQLKASTACEGFKKEKKNQPKPRRSLKKEESPKDEFHTSCCSAVTVASKTMKLVAANELQEKCSWANSVSWLESTPGVWLCRTCLEHKPRQRGGNRQLQLEVLDRPATAIHPIRLLHRQPSLSLEPEVQEQQPQRWSPSEALNSASHRCTQALPTPCSGNAPLSLKNTPASLATGYPVLVLGRQLCKSYLSPRPLFQTGYYLLGNFLPCSLSWYTAPPWAGKMVWMIRIAPILVLIMSIIIL